MPVDKTKPNTSTTKIVIKMVASELRETTKDHINYWKKQLKGATADNEESERVFPRKDDEFYEQLKSTKDTFVTGDKIAERKLIRIFNPDYGQKITRPEKMDK